MNITPHIPRGARFTIGSRIENKFIDLLELTYTAYFTEKDRKSEKLSECILVLDTLKFLISVAWEGKIISNKHCEDVSGKLEEVGRMLGGWKKNLDPLKKPQPSKGCGKEKLLGERKQHDCQDSTCCLDSSNCC